MKFKISHLKSGFLRRLLSTVLAVTMVAGLLPASALATGSAGRPDPAYSRKAPEVGILNAYTGTNTALYKAIRTAASSHKYSADRYDAFPDLFGVLGTFLGTDQYSWQDDFAGHTTYADSTLRELSKVYGNLEVNISATLVNDPHSHTHAKGLNKYKYEITDYEKVYLQIGPYTPVNLAGVYPEANKNSTKPMVGDYDGVSNENMSSDARNGTDSYGIVRYSADNTTFQVRFVGMDFTYDHFGDTKTCTCNHTSADFPMMTFRDARAPQVAGVYYSLDDGTSWTRSTSGLRVKENSTLLIKLCFDEPIRFADDSAAGKGDLYLELQSDGTSTGYENRKAYLTKLDGNDLYFTYTFTEENVDWNIRTLDMSNLFGSGLPLVQVDGTVTFLPRYIPTDDTTGFTTTTCHITDLAGNAMQTRTVSSGDLELDSLKPYLKNVQFNLSLNNADVKKALGKTDPSDTDYTDASDLYLGVGDSVRLVLNMNERLKIDTLTGYKAVATTNIKDETGSSVTVESQYFTPESERLSGSNTSWFMAPITMEEGWTVADANGQIKVTALHFTGGSATITDLAGNPLNADGEGSVSIDPAANANPPMLDVTAPTVKPSGAETPEGAGFYYAVDISDPNGSGIAGLPGKFVLRNGTVAAGGDGKNYDFEYAVTQSASTPGTWKIGRTGVAYDFDQGTTVYLHIRPKEGETYINLSACTLTVRANDYAGNMCNVTLPSVGVLNWYIDNQAPTITAGETTRALKTDPTQGGTMTVNFTLSDTHGISQWQYAWSDSKMAAPADSEWTAGALNSLEMDQTSLTRTLTVDVASGNYYSRYLWVKAADHCSDTSAQNNASEPICLGLFAYDLRKAQYNLDYYTGITQKASMKVSSINENDYLVFLVKGTTDSVYALLRVDNEKLTASNLTELDIFSLAAFNSSSIIWRYGYTCTEEPSGHYTLAETKDTDAQNAVKKTMQNVSGSDYSGELEVIVLSGKKAAVTDEIAASQQMTLGNESYSFSKDTVPLKAAGSAWNNFEGISITSSSTMGGTYNAEGNSYNVTLDAPARSTLAGTEFTISIARDKNGWNYADVNWKGSYVELKNVSTNTSYQFELRPVQAASDGSVTQTLTIPEGDYESGLYSAVLYLTCYAGRSLMQEFKLSDGRSHFVVDVTKPSNDFSLTALTYEPKEQWANKYGIGTYYGTLDCLGDAENGVITLPVANTTGGTFGTGYPGESYRFTISSPSEPAIAVNSKGYRLQMWNTADTTNVLTITPTDEKTVQNNHGSYINDDAYGFVFEKPATEAEAAKYLYLKPDQENIVAMQKVYFNGLKSEIKYIHIKPVTQYVTGSVSVDFQTHELVFTPTDPASAVGAKIYAWAWQDTEQPLYGEGERIDMAPASDGTWRCGLAENGANYKVITVNSAGSICDAGSITEQAPKVGLYQSAPGVYGAYELIFSVRDGKDTMRNGITLDIGFNEAYSTDHLSFMYKDGTYSWTETGASTTGISSVEAKLDHSTTDVDRLLVTVKGCYKDVTAGTPMNVTLTATDALGQTSAGSSGNITVDYQKPIAYTGTGNPDWDPKLGDDGLVLTFSQPVRPTESWAWHETDTAGFHTQWEGAFPIIGNGTYTLEFVDIFGNTCTQELTTTAFTKNGKNYSVDLSFSDEGMTKEAVSVTARTADGFLTFWAGDGSGTIWSKDGVYDTIRLIDENGEEWTRDTSTMSPSDEEYYFKNIGKRLREICWNTNGKMKIRVGGASYAEGNRIFTQTVYIGNIAVAAPAAEVRYFVYALGDEFTQTELEQYIAENKDISGKVTVTGNVEVWYKTTRAVTPTEGGSQYLFTWENYQAGHTFAYQDELGNTASVHVTLPEGLTLQKPGETVDTTAPSVSVDIYTKIGGTYTQAEVFAPGDTAAEIAQKFAELGYVQGYNLAVNASDASGYDIALTDGEGNALTADSGATLSGNMVNITKAGTFTITVTDCSKNENATWVTFTVPQNIDTTAPTGSITVTPQSLYKKTLTITLTDNIPGDVTLSLPADARPVDGTPNKYTYDVTDNRTVEFVFYDQVGNRGTKSMSVAGIDTDPPKLTAEWAPPHTYQDSEGETVVDRSQPTWGPVNTSVTVRIRSDKAMYNLSVQAENEATAHDLLIAGVAQPYSIPGLDVTFDVTPDLVTVTYNENYSQELTFTATAPNGKSRVLTLSRLYGVIDKTAPEITVDNGYKFREENEVNASVPYAVEVILTPNEPVTSPNYGAKDARNEPIWYSRSKQLILTFTENGTYNVRFVDKAGNATIKPVVIAGIDNTAPGLTVTTVKGDNNVEVTVTANEDCKLTWGDTGTRSLTAGVSQTITLTENGTYVFTAEDGAFNKSYKTVWVYSIDNISPSISFAKNTLYVMEDSPAADLAAALDTGYTVWDNVTEAGWPQVSVDRSQVDLSTAGQYTVTYTVTDKAGNVTTANRFVRVIGSNTVCLNVDGSLTLPDSTVVLAPGSHTLTLQNNSEPYSIKARKGVLSTGQMKYLSGNSLSFDANGNFSVTATGYYTLLVTTQSRQTIRILLYVEQ